MLTTTANLCETQLLDNLEIYVGTHIGSFKAIKITKDGTTDAHKAVSLHNADDIGKTCNVTTLEWANPEHTELFLGKENQMLKVYNPTEKMTTQSVLLSGVPVGCVRLSDNILAAGLSNGTIQLVNLDKRDAELDVLSAGDNMTRMRSCPTKPSLVATGGKLKQNNVKVWDLEAKKQLFESKNVRPNELQLEMPIWDNDMSFLSETTIATCSRHGYIRYYDTRSQRRPVAAFQSSDRDQFSFTSLATRGDLAYVGLTVGGLQCYDLRQLKRAVHVYKAAIGSISDVCIAGETGQFLVSASLDRFIRVHSTSTNALIYQNYMQSKVTRVLCDLSTDQRIEANKLEDEEEADELGDILEQLPIAGEDDEEPRKRRRRN